MEKVLLWCLVTATDRIAEFRLCKVSSKLGFSLDCAQLGSDLGLLVQPPNNARLASSLSVDYPLREQKILRL